MGGSYAFMMLFVCWLRLFSLDLALVRYGDLNAAAAILEHTLATQA